jgi:hypothetical protein
MRPHAPLRRFTTRNRTQIRPRSARYQLQGPKPWRKAAPVHLVRMNDDLADWIAEDMWRKARWIGNQRRAAHAIWLGLTEAEKNHWRTLARVLLAVREQQECRRA